MSKQTGEFPDEPQIPKGKPSKKRKGKYELWVFFEGGFWRKPHWWKMRTYPTLELAEQNLKAYQRKNTYGNRHCEIRVKEGMVESPCSLKET